MASATIGPNLPNHCVPNTGRPPTAALRQGCDLGHKYASILLVPLPARQGGWGGNLPVLPPFGPMAVAKWLSVDRAGGTRSPARRTPSAPGRVAARPATARRGGGRPPRSPRPCPAGPARRG